MNKTILLNSAIITALAITIVLSSYIPAAKAQRLFLPGGINVGPGGVSVDVGRHHIHADQCSGVGVGSNGGSSLGMGAAIARCALSR
ncbi:MAG: hypothetical protein M3044_01725 [Thermoproteota archaeon]|nr:hypothetical protein [Thermoproteota archaeon]